MADDKPLKALVVDDERVVRDFLKRYLEMNGAQVVIAVDGFEAIEATHKERFDIVFIDARMPRMNGLETFRALKKNNPGARFVMMTGYEVEDLLESAKKEGLSAALKKPFDLQLLAILLKQCRTEDSDFNKDPRVLVVDDDAGVLELFKQLLKERGYEAVIIDSGEQALEAVVKNEFDVIFLDVVLKDISGVELGARIRELRPKVEIVFMTGYNDQVQEGILKLGISNCLYKPFEIKQVYDHIERIRNSHQ